MCFEPISPPHPFTALPFINVARSMNAKTTDSVVVKKSIRKGNTPLPLYIELPLIGPLIHLSPNAPQTPGLIFLNSFGVFKIPFGWFVILSVLLIEYICVLK